MSEPIREGVAASGSERFAREGCECDRQGRADWQECIYDDPCPNHDTATQGFQDAPAPWFPASDAPAASCHESVTDFTAWEEAASFEISLEALIAACQPGKTWSDRALRDAPQEIILPLAEECLRLRRADRPLSKGAHHG